MNHCVDLHTHSSASDGTDSPRALVAAAASTGLCAIALTDHDTLSGLDEAAAAGEEFGVAVARGCEIAAASPFGELHLLGLWLPEKAPRLEAALAEIRRARDERNREMLEKLRRAGHDVSWRELLDAASGGVPGRPHLARLLVEKGACSSVREAFARFLGDGKSAYVPRRTPSLEEGLDILRSEGAVTVFAHPMLLKAPFDKLGELVREMAGMGLDAIEAHHSDHDARAVRRAESLAAQYGLAVSGGSDYHGQNRPDVRLGFGRGNLRLPHAMFERLLSIRESRKIQSQTAGRGNAGPDVSCASRSSKGFCGQDQ